MRRLTTANRHSLIFLFLKKVETGKARGRRADLAWVLKRRRILASWGIYRFCDLTANARKIGLGDHEPAVTLAGIARKIRDQWACRGLRQGRDPIFISPKPATRLRNPLPLNGPIQHCRLTEVGYSKRRKAKRLRGDGTRGRLAKPSRHTTSSEDFGRKADNRRLRREYSGCTGNRSWHKSPSVAEKAFKPDADDLHGRAMLMGYTTAKPSHGSRAARGESFVPIF